MNRNILKTISGLALLAAAPLCAPAYAEVHIGVGIYASAPYVEAPPVYYEPAPRYYSAPPPVYYGPGVVYQDDREHAAALWRGRHHGDSYQSEYHHHHRHHDHDD